jgi:hypothetical protein
MKKLILTIALILGVITLGVITSGLSVEFTPTNIAHADCSGSSC